MFTSASIFVVGAIVGFGLCYWFGLKPSKGITAQDPGNALLQARLEESQRRIKELEKGVHAVPPPALPASIPVPVDDSKPVPMSMTPGKSMKDLTARMIKMSMQQRLIAMKSRLKLSPEQESQINAILKNWEDSIAAGQTPAANIGQQFLDVLTPDQRSEYQKMQTEERTSAAETMATLGVNQLSASLNLTDQQKDQVFNALAQVQMMDPATRQKMVQDLIAQGMQPADAYTEIQRQALSKILTPEQMETYNQQLVAQRELMRTMILPATNR